jgi:hypothetical protein
MHEAAGELCAMADAACDRALEAKRKAALRDEAAARVNAEPAAPAEPLRLSGRMMTISTKPDATPDA